MFKRTNGYILLVLLVITGLGSQVSNETLSSKERRFLVQHLKETRNQLLYGIKGLSEAQLNFRPTPDQWSIREQVEHLLLVEEYFYTKATEALRHLPQKEDAAAASTDKDILTAVANRSHLLQEHKPLDPHRAKAMSVHEAIHTFKENRTQSIKFVRTTTDNIRRHVTEVPYGHADAYQVLLGMSAYSQKCLQQINKIKSHPRFPK